jgi:hypothetical protein
MRVVLELDELEGEVGRQLLEIANRLVEHLEEEAPMGATGDLQRSIQIFRASDGRVVLGTRIHYAAHVNYGTEPHRPPFEPIQKWARRKLGDEGAAWGVWNKIAQEGTKANPFVDRAIEATLDEF